MSHLFLSPSYSELCLLSTSSVKLNVERKKIAIPMTSLILNTWLQTATLQWNITHIANLLYHSLKWLFSPIIPLPFLIIPTSILPGSFLRELWNGYITSERNFLVVAIPSLQIPQEFSLSKISMDIVIFFLREIEKMHLRNNY